MDSHPDESPSKSSESGDLATQILKEIPMLVLHQSGPCQCNSAACKLNSKLLKYFLDNEFKKKQKESPQKESKMPPMSLEVTSTVLKAEEKRKQSQ